MQRVLEAGGVFSSDGQHPPPLLVQMDCAVQRRAHALEPWGRVQLTALALGLASI